MKKPTWREATYTFDLCFFACFARNSVDLLVFGSLGHVSRGLCTNSRVGCTRTSTPWRSLYSFAQSLDTFLPHVPSWLVCVQRLNVQGYEGPKQ